ncbi:MAG: hypothetical protein U1E62_18130 [Alsobacter sp.]
MQAIPEDEGGRESREERPAALCHAVTLSSTRRTTRAAAQATPWFDRHDPASTSPFNRAVLHSLQEPAMRAASLLLALAAGLLIAPTAEARGHGRGGHGSHHGAHGHGGHSRPGWFIIR